MRQPVGPEMPAVAVLRTEWANTVGRRVLVPLDLAVGLTWGTNPEVLRIPPAQRTGILSLEGDPANPLHDRFRR